MLLKVMKSSLPVMVWLVYPRSSSFCCVSSTSAFLFPVIALYFLFLSLTSSNVRSPFLTSRYSSMLFSASFTISFFCYEFAAYVHLLLATLTIKPRQANKKRASN